MAITVVPDQDPGQVGFYYAQMTSPYTTSWWTTQEITEIPTESVGWLVAQGWQVTNIDQDASTQPPTYYYDMQRNSIENWPILQSLMDEYTTKYNDAVYTNATRYNDVVENWTTLISTTHDYLESQVLEQNTHVASYLADLGEYMDSVESDTTQLEEDYDLHSLEADEFLTNLGATDLARINEEFAASLAKQTQQLANLGAYTSLALADITARNTRDRDEQVQLLNDRLNREKLDNRHKLYEQKFRVRNQMVSNRMSSYTTRLDGLAKTHAQDIAMMQYTMEQRNQLIIGLYGFVERREDVYPRFESLVQIATGLGDAGGGWVTP